MTSSYITGFMARHKLALLFLTLLACTAMLGIHTSKVYAETPDCGVQTGDPTENFEGLVATMSWQTAAGVSEGQANNTWVSVSSASAVTGKSDAYIDNSEGGTDSSVAFNQQDYNCPNTGDGWSVVLGYGYTSQNVNSAGQAGPGAIGAGSGEWYLRCGFDEDNPQTFTVAGEGVPTGAEPGGTWSTFIFTTGTNNPDEPQNGGTAYGSLVYTEPSTTTISGTIYNWNKTTGTGSVEKDAIVDTCTGSSTTANSNGVFNFTVTPGESFCVKFGGTVPTGATLELSPNSNGPPPVLPFTCNGSTVSYVDLVGASPSSGCSADDNGGYDIAIVSGSSTTCTPTPNCPCGDNACTPCPNQPSESTDPNINLPQGDQPSGTTSSTAPTGITTTPSTWQEDQPTGKYEIVYAGDQYGTTIGWSPTGYNTNPFTLNYTNYITAHPYDPHSTTVEYNEDYIQTDWKTTFDYWSCSSGTLSGSSCITTTITAATENCTTTGTGKKAKTTCTYSCPSGSTLSGTNCVTTTSNPATAVYDWEQVGTASTLAGPNTIYSGSPQLGECYSRTFSLQPTGTSVSLTSTTSSDVPSKVNVVGYVDATFGLDGPEGTPEAACKVNGITTTIAAYYIAPGNPTPEPLSQGSQSTSMNYGQSPGCNNMSPTQVSATFSTGIGPGLLAYGDTVCAYISVTPDGNYMDYTGQITNENGTSNPNGNGQTSINPSNAPAPYSFTDCSGPIAAEPYFKAFGGDVSAGLDSDYISGCYDNAAGIYSWNQGGSTGSTGAGTTAAALASSSISGFASGQNILNMLSPPPLTFANYPSAQYGGSYGRGGNCGGPDYYTLAQNIPGAVSCPSEIDSATLAQQGVTFVNPLNPTITVGQNDHYICYSLNKSVTIASNITYSPLPANTPTNDLPSFEVVVKGANIYIDTPFNQGSGTSDPSQPVTQLFGNYVAEISNGQGGTINDTAPDGNIDVCAYNAPGAENDYNNSCTQDRLVVDGSFTANQVDLYRSYGTLHDASSSSTYSPSSCSNTGGGDCYDAEEFDFGPINWLTPGNDNLIIQSITSLPPVL